MKTGNVSAVFHEGECAVQARMGVQVRLEEVGPRVIRDYMPEQHRTFFMQLPFVIVGSVEASGQPWASVLANPPGFIQSTDSHSLNIFASPQRFDPLHKTLIAGARVGLLGIEPHSRRRNRMNGLVSSVNDAGFVVQVNQSFGNCPKYIQARKPEYVAHNALVKKTVYQSNQLDEAARKLILGADTFFIATAYLSESESKNKAHGVDVSHRGGKPGFVRVDDSMTFTVPDFSGNLFFNTIGNLTVNPRAGLLFIDFESGDLLYLAVEAQVIWEGAEVELYEGAERLLRFHLMEMKRVTAGLPMRWSAAELSPVLAQIGSW